jgi:hypothetical protein
MQAFLGALWETRLERWSPERLGEPFTK